MTNYKTTNCSNGDSIELQNDLSATEVEALGSDILAVVHDADATQTTYERRNKRDRGPKNTDLNIPDSAVIVQMSQSGIDILVEV
ncbi:hypothetical protein [Haloarcula sp. H-GB5]